MESHELYKVDYWNTKFVMFATFFFIVGGCLGGGIMVIPVEEAMTGFWAFLGIIILPFLFECLAVILFIQIIQKVRKVLAKESDEKNMRLENYGESYHKIPNEPLINHEESEDVEYAVQVVEDFSSTDVSLTTETKEVGDHRSGQVVEILSKKRFPDEITPNNNKTKEKKVSNFFLMSGIDLHTISSSYFPSYYRLFVDLIIMFKSFPIVHIIGCSQTAVSIFTNDSALVLTRSRFMAPIIASSAFSLVFFFSYFFEALISLMTCIKATLLVFVCFLGILLFSPFSSETDLRYVSRVYFTESWLICCIVLMIPSMFSKVRPSKKNMIYFTITVVFAISFCQVIAIVWSVVIWGVVPQDGSTGSEINLKRSLELGELSNIPFTLILRKKYPGFVWLGYLIQIFIAMSLVVSTLIFASVFKSMVDGIIKQFSNWFNHHYYNTQQPTNIQNNHNQEENGRNENRNIDEEEIQTEMNQNELVSSCEGDYEQQILQNERQKLEGEETTTSRLEINPTDEQRRSGKRISIFAFQILAYLGTIILATFSCYAFYKMEFFLSQITSFLSITIEVFFVCGLIWVDIVKNPFKGEKIWFEIPRFLFVSLGVLLGVYFVVVSIWFYVYSTINWVYIMKDSKIPF